MKRAPSNTLPQGHSRLVLGRDACGYGVYIPAIDSMVRIVRDRDGHLALMIEAPRNVSVIREELLPAAA